MSNKLKLIASLVGFILGLVAFYGISYAYSQPQVNFDMETKSNFINDQGMTFIGVINNSEIKPLMISSIYLEVYDSQHNLIGFVENHNPLTLQPNGNSVWKVVVTDQDVPSLDSISTVAAGASVINIADFN